MGQDGHDEIIARKPAFAVQVGPCHPLVGNEYGVHEPTDCLDDQVPCKSDFNVVPFQPPCQYFPPASSDIDLSRNHRPGLPPAPIVANQST